MSHQEPTAARPASARKLSLALGILSSAQEKLVAQRFGETTGRFARRRHVIRTSWLRSAVVNDSVCAHFVLRCGGLDERTVTAIAVENRSAADLLCASVPASDGRVRGPLLALWWWLRYAYHAYPHARFVGKADDDVFVHLPDAERLLLTIPPSVAPNALLGVIMYFQLTTFPNAYEIHSFGSTAQTSRKHRTPPSLRCDDGAGEEVGVGASVRGARGANGTNASSLSGPSGKRCYGPFPLPCGPFWALGRGVVRSLMSADGEVAADLERIRALPASNHRILDDVWLGSILWRFVGGAVPVALFTIDARGPLFFDRSDRFRAHPSEVIWHNRLKFVNRVRVLHAFHSARNGSLHCTAPVRWIHIKPHCCSWKGPPVRLPNGKLRRSRPGDGRVHTDGHPWPLYYGFANTSTCRGHEPVDLMRKYKWRASYGMDIDPAQNSLHEKA